MSNEDDEARSVFTSWTVSTVVFLTVAFWCAVGAAAAAFAGDWFAFFWSVVALGLSLLIADDRRE